MQNKKFYIGTKLNHAWPEELNEKPGYAVVYKDGYQSWCPKIVFEQANICLGDGNSNTVTQEMVDKFIVGAEVLKMGLKTTVVQATLLNGFTVTESSACVDPANYDEKIGVDLCMTKIKDKVWELLGFLLQSAINGLAIADGSVNCVPASTGVCPSCGSNQYEDYDDDHVCCMDCGEVFPLVSVL